MVDFKRFPKLRKKKGEDRLQYLPTPTTSNIVYTPRKIVEDMLDLLPSDIWSNPDAKFLDPCCKSGAFLECIYWRLEEGLKELIPDFIDRSDHILTKQLFGLALNPQLAEASRATLYGTYRADHKNAFTRRFDTREGNIHVLEWFTDKNKYYYFNVIKNEAMFNATIKEAFGDMKFDVIIGNPPYQENDGGGTGSSAKPLYHFFVDRATKLNPKYISMIIPARWYSGGKGLDNFRIGMLNSNKISRLVDYRDGRQCFEDVDIAGGVCYFLWEKDYSGECLVKNADSYSENTLMRKLNEYSIFIRDNTAISIVRKAKNLSTKDMSSMVFSRNSFNVLSSFVGASTKDSYNNISLTTLNGKFFTNKSVINDRDELLDKYKSIMTKAISGGNRPSQSGDYQVIPNTIQVLGPNEACSETYLCLGSFATYEEANNLCMYMRTKFFRFLLLQALTQIGISKDKFQLIPVQDFTKPWTDAELYAKYNLTQEEIDFIESLIKPME